MQTKQAGSMTIEAMLVIPTVLLILIFFIEMISFFATKNKLEQIANYTINYWAKNTVTDCNDVDGWLATNALEPALTHYNMDPASVSLTTDHPIMCNCAGGTIALTLTSNNGFFANYSIITPSAYAIAIKEGNYGENC